MARGYHLEIRFETTNENLNGVLLNIIKMLENSDIRPDSIELFGMED